MFKINGEAESPHKGAHLGGVLNKMYDEPISLAKHANVASGSVNAAMHTHSVTSKSATRSNVNSFEWFVLHLDRARK